MANKNKDTGMSDAMTNREIEDVLTSIRRLVAQEGGRNAETGRLILTEAQRIVAGSVVDSDCKGQGGATESAPGGDVSLPLELTDPVATAETGDTVEEGRDLPAPDFGQLEATIAELEAAVSGNADASMPGTLLGDDRIEDEDEDQTDTAIAPEPSDVPGEASNVTALYGRLSFHHRRSSMADAGTGSENEPNAGSESGAFSRFDPEDVHAMATTPEQADDTPDVAPTIVDEDRYSLPPEAAVTATEARSDSSEHPVEPVRDDDVAPAIPGEAEDTVIDEAMLRVVVAQLVREELHGQLGERITLQVRKLVRAEIAKALDERNYL